MIKKFSLPAIAMAILAFAVPALASASTGLTEGGKLIPVGSKITKTSTNAVVESASLGKLTCEKITLNGEVTKNNAAEGVEGIGIGEGTGTNCKRNGSVAIIVNRIRMLNTLKSPASTPGKGTATFTFSAVLPELTCNFSSMNAPGTYVANTDNFTLTKVPLTVSPVACGSATLSATFTIEKTGTSSAIIIM